MFEDMQLRSEPWFLILVIAWIETSLQMVSCSLVIKYLKSKPPGCQTVVDDVNLAFFTVMIIMAVINGLRITVIAIWFDSGEIAAVGLGQT